MSAYLCDAPTIAAIARLAASLHPEIDAERVFGVLLDENLKSVGYRYPDAQRISDWFDEGEAAFVWETIPEAQHSATELLDMVKSYQYQSCEHPEWKESPACELTTILRELLGAMAAEEAKAEQQATNERRAAYQKHPSLEPKETAVAIRKLLKAQYPATKFRVVTERGSMVSSVRISWTDGPTTKAVDSLVKCFEAGHFDGMTDSYDYDRDTLLSIDGQMYRPGCRYVFTVREISATLANRCIAQLVTYWGGIENAPVAVDGPCGFSIPDGVGHRPIRSDLTHMEDWYSMIHQAAGDHTRFARD